jgi:hypothetical protein
MAFQGTKAKGGKEWGGKARKSESKGLRKAAKQALRRRAVAR